MPGDPGGPADGGTTQGGGDSGGIPPAEPVILSRALLDVDPEDDQTPSELPFPELDEQDVPDDEPQQPEEESDETDLVLSLVSPSSLPGGLSTARGEGCPSRSEVELFLDGRRIARTMAAADGTFEALLELPQLDVGVYDIEARCGDVVQTVPLTLVITSSSGSVAGAATTTGVVLAFFVLVASLFVMNSQGAPVVTQTQTPDEDDDLEP